MAKLYFRYGAMNSGKSTILLQVAYNYEERNQRVAVGKPEVDSKGGDLILSRLGVSRKADFLLGADDDPRESLAQWRKRIAGGGKCPGKVDAFLVDEAQFLSAQQVDQLLRIALLDDIPVLAFGLRTDYQTLAFPGSRRLLEVAHSLEELKTICQCGRKALFTCRKEAGCSAFTGSQVSIEGGSVTYESLCGNCYLHESGGKLAPR